MGDVAALLQAIGGLSGLVTAAAGAFVLVWTTVRNSRKERHKAAEKAASRALQELAEAAKDGEITADEIDQVLRKLQGGDEE